MSSRIKSLANQFRSFLQLSAVAFYLTEFGILLVLYPLLLLYLCFTKYWPFVFIYALWFVYDFGQHERGGRQFKWPRRLFFWRYASDYFPVQLIRAGDASLYSPDRNYLFCLQPHGLFSLGTIFSLVTNGANFDEKFKGLKRHILTVPAQVVLPIHREISMAMGYCSASKKSLMHLLDRKRKGNVAMLMLGGAYEAIYAYEHSMNIAIKSRKGFIKVAIQTGASLVPVIVFGENNMYKVKKFSKDHLITKMQKLFANIFNTTFVVFSGRAIILPFRTPINTVVGLPIEVQQDDNPTNEQINKLHQTYLDALNELYDQYSPIYGDKGVMLNIM